MQIGRLAAANTPFDLRRGASGADQKHTRLPSRAWAFSKTRPTPATKLWLMLKCAVSWTSI
jgi:hypothetical protein